MNEVTIALVGIGGYGGIYVNELLANANEHQARLVAAIDPYAQERASYNQLLDAGIPIYPDLETFFRHDTADLVIISAAIHAHAPLTCLALEQGSNVLCEKPLCSDVAQIHQMQAAEKRSGKFVAVGYQWSFSKTIQDLKQDVLAGEFGKPKRLYTKVFWPRNASYFRRNGWAGKVRMPDGSWVLDSPAHNATAHYLHNMLYILGDSPAQSDTPLRVQAECYRANPIENFDTCAMRIQTQSGAEILYYATHAVANESGPIARYEFDSAVVEFQRGETATFTAKFKDGRVKDYGNPFVSEMDKLWQAVDAVRTGEPLLCGIEAAVPQVLCILGANQSRANENFPASMVRISPAGEDDNLTWAEGLEEVLEICYQEAALPSEIPGTDWAKPGKVVDVSQFYPLTVER